MTNCYIEYDKQINNKEKLIFQIKILTDKARRKKKEKINYTFSELFSRLKTYSWRMHLLKILYYLIESFWLNLRNSLQNSRSVKRALKKIELAFDLEEKKIRKKKKKKNPSARKMMSIREEEQLNLRKKKKKEDFIRSRESFEKTILLIVRELYSAQERCDFIV